MKYIFLVLLLGPINAFALSDIEEKALHLEWMALKYEAYAKLFQMYKNDITKENDDTKTRIYTFQYRPQVFAILCRTQNFDEKQLVVSILDKKWGTKSSEKIPRYGIRLYLGTVGIPSTRGSDIIFSIPGAKTKKYIHTH